MKIRNKIAGGATIALLGLGMAVSIPMSASAHTPDIKASCTGVSLKATSYDASKLNTWTVTVGGVTQSGTFGASLNLNFPVAQENGITSYSATIQAEDGSYSQTKSGDVGPCGTTTIQLPLLGAADGTCTAPGYLVPNFTKWPAAQNPNGFEGDGFRVYLNKPYNGPGTYIATLQKVGAGFDPKYPNGTKVVGQTTQTIVVQPQISDEICAGDQPESKVVTTEWVDEKLTCDSRAVTQHRTVTTTPYIRVGQTWVEDTANATVVTETQYRAKTADEVKPCIEVPASVFTDSSSDDVNCDTEIVTKTTLYYQSDAVWNAETRSYDSFTEPYLIDTKKVDREATIEELDAAECPVDEQPENKVDITSSEFIPLACDTTTAEITTVTVTTPFILVDREWVLDEANAVSVETKSSRTLTKAEQDATICAVALAFTGSDSFTPVTIGAGMLLIGGTIIALSKIRARRREANNA